LRKNVERETFKGGRKRNETSTALLLEKSYFLPPIGERKKKGFSLRTKEKGKNGTGAERKKKNSGQKNAEEWTSAACF